ncbi:hypothetical protein AA0113_g9203 [Alternaria arborescens]|uniref:LisH domain-containing protein n=1 Tax=Alternaria arborescens TaxID=156630 RepID=A0A4Q4RC21_9PLEO|nr:hypothetical protein AA0112_g9895 [Alternaria arborescens]RYO54113.1 hypothetical protein AA0113_g9203 [Alternaria arborescens]
MQNQQMAQMQAQMNANGSVNGTPVMGNMAQPKRMGNNDPVEKLNTYIYDYFLRNRHHALARAMLDGDLKMSTEKPSPNKSNVASDIDMPDDMPLPALPAGQVADNSFLLDWWVQFWDIFAAARGPNGGPKNAVQYLGHNRNLGQMQNEQRNQRLMMANNPMANAQYMMARNGAMTNGKPTELQRTAHMNNRPTGNPMAGMQSMKNPNMIQMQRDGSNMDMNGNRPNSPGSNENAPSPNKRPRVEGGMNAGNMPNNQFNEFMPQGPGAQQKNIEGINSGVQGSPMAQSGLDGQDLTFAGNGPRPGSMPTNPPGAPQQGNHALQDYQMQLMLLEQQNKKRLLMARQEQDNQSGHPQQGVIGAPGFGAAMSPQGSRAGGPSPNPADQMKRGTPKLGQQNLPGSPMPEGIMGQQRGSPAPNMNFDPTLAPPGMPPQFYPQNMGPGPNGNPMMRPPSSHPNGGPQFNGQPMTQEQMQAMRNGQMAQNGWRGGPQPGMMGPGGQQMGGPMGQNPQQRQQMPPPPAPTNEQPRPEPSPSVSNQAPPTPNQGNKANPKKKVTKDNKKPANKKGNAGATPATSNGEEPPTPTSSTPVAPITPVHKQSFNQGQNGGPQQPVQPQPPSDQPMDNGGPPFGNIDGDPNGIDLAFNFGDDAGALENFDFDSFLHTGNDNDAFGNLVSDFDFPNAAEV